MAPKDITTTPLVSEQIDVGREVETSTATLEKHVETHDVIVDEPLVHEHASVEHVPKNEWVTGDAPPKMREENGVLIVPVLEEVLVKRLRLKEELHVKLVREETHEPQKVTLRRERVSLKRDEQ